jgi:hydroxymethylpyrimidine pyrophosphatase-like HAD family hydrolase
MEYAQWDEKSRKLIVTEKRSVPIDKPSVTERIEYLRRETGYTEYKGETVEFHESGMLTFPLLGTAAALPDKIAFDPDRKKRRKIYPLVAETFGDYNAFVGGSSSFDMSPKPYCKLEALGRYCSLHNISRDEVVYVGDDYGTGGNDEDVYKSDIAFICVDNYLDFGKCVSKLF